MKLNNKISNNKIEEDLIPPVTTEDPQYRSVGYNSDEPQEKRTTNIINGMSSNEKTTHFKKERFSKGFNKTPLIVILVLIVLVGCFYVYFNYVVTPYKMFSLLANTYYNKVVTIAENKSIIGKEAKTIKIDGHSSISSTNLSYILLSGYNADYKVGIDINENKVYSEITLNKDKKALIDALLFVKNNKLYIDSSKIYDKVLYSALSESDSSKKTDTTSMLYLLKLAKDTFLNNINRDNISKKFTYEKINGKTFVGNKITYVIDSKEYNNIKNSIIKSYLNDKTAMEYLKEIINNDDTNITELLNSLLKEDKIDSITIDAYVTLVSNEFVKLNIKGKNTEVSYEESKSNIVFSLTGKVDTSSEEMNYSINFDYDINNNKINLELISGEMKVVANYSETIKSDNLYSGNLVINIYSNKLFTKADTIIKSDFTYSLNEKVEDAIVGNTIDYSKLSDKEKYKIMENLYNALGLTNLYNSLIEGISDGKEIIEF